MVKDWLMKLHMCITNGLTSMFHKSECDKSNIIVIWDLRYVKGSNTTKLTLQFIILK